MKDGFVILIRPANRLPYIFRKEMIVMKMKKLGALLLALLLSLSVFSACGSGGSQATDAPTSTASAPKPEETSAPAVETEKLEETVSDDDVDGELIVDHEEQLQYAQFFTMTHYKGGYISFTVIGGEEDYEWLIVPEGKRVPEGLADNVVVLQQPLDRIRCGSTPVTMIAAFDGLDHVSSINVKEDTIAVDKVAEAINAGKIVYSGSYKEPDYETITAQGTQLVFDSNMLDSCPEVKEKYEELGIPYVVVRDSKEVHPLGSAEWVKIYGAVLGMWDEANAYFDAQIEQVNAVTTDEKLGKTVAIVYYSMDGTKVYARRGGDAYAAMVDLAGGEYIMKDFEPEKTGVATITMEDYFALCKDADYLINLNLAAHLYTIDELLEIAPFMEDFKSVKDGNVYAARDRISQFGFDNAGIIADMNTILKDSTVESTNYFSKMK